MFRKIRLPQALPHIFTGLKVGAALAATAAVVAEFVASDRGLGYLLLQYNGQLDTPMVFATIVVLSLIGLAVYYAVEIDRAHRHSLARLAAGDGQGRNAFIIDGPPSRKHYNSKEETHEDRTARRALTCRGLAAGAAPAAHAAGQGVAASQLVSRRPARAVLLRQGQGLLRRRRHRPHDQRRPRLGQHRAGRRRRLRHLRARRLLVGDRHRGQGRRRQERDVAAQHHGLFGGVAGRGGIKTPKDLEGKKVAVTAGDPLAQLLQAVCKANNVDCAKIGMVQVDPAAKVVTVLEKKTDALLGGADDQYFLIKYKGGNPAAMRYADFGANIVGMTIMTSGDTIKKNPDLVRRFVRATVSRGRRQRRTRMRRWTRR